MLRRLTGQNRHQIRERVVADLVVALQTDPAGLAQILLGLRHRAVEVEPTDAVDTEDKHAQLPRGVSELSVIAIHAIEHFLRIQNRVNVLVYRFRRELRRLRLHFGFRSRFTRDVHHFHLGRKRHLSREVFALFNSSEKKELEDKCSP